MSIDTPKATGGISVVVVNYNAGSLLAGCVGLGLSQADEVIVIDNASADESIAILESTFADEPRLKIIRNNKNLGFSAACNIGTEAATGEYLFYLNPDCLLQDQTVSRLISAFETDEHAVMVGGLLTNPDGSEQGGGRRAVPTPWRSFVRAFGLSRFANRWPRLFYDFHLHKQPLPENPISVEAISGACMLVKREAIEEVGRWDEGYFLHCEDLDLCMRLRRKGWDILFVPDAPVIHYIGKCSHSRPIFVEWHKHKGMIRFYRKFFSHQYPGVMMWLVALGVWLRFACVVAYYSARQIFRWLGFGREK